jgi:hypothetical protein
MADLFSLAGDPTLGESVEEGVTRLRRGEQMGVLVEGGRVLDGVSQCHRRAHQYLWKWWRNSKSGDSAR